MNKKEGLNLLDYLASGINKEDPAIKAILSDEDGNGASANELDELVEFINYYIHTDDVKNHKGRPLEMIINMFTKQWRYIGESDDRLLRRFLALICRKGTTVWGDKVDLKNIFETYYNGIKCYVADNTNKDSMLPDGDFSLDDVWELGGGAVFDYEARFSGLRGLLFSGNTMESCSQTVEDSFLADNYTFHFMLWGKCGVVIQREDGKYWNANDQEFSGDVILEWVDNVIINIFEKPFGWDDASCFIVLPEDLRSLSIKFVGFEGERALIDYARLYVKPLNPSYSLIIQYFGYLITDKTLHLGINGDEPIPELDYSKESHFDSSFVVGPEVVSSNKEFDIILDKVRPLGIQAFVEIVERRE